MKKYSVTLILLFISALLGASGLQEMSSLTPGSPITIDSKQEFFTRSVQLFSDQLFFVESLKENNAMLSPLSVLLALGMTTNGADGATLSSMLDVLLPKQGTLKLFNEANAQYLDSIKNLNKVELSIANSLWLNREVRFDQAFLNKTSEA